ncbi:MAG: ABC transporter permease [Planctomycetota bacterium]
MNVWRIAWNNMRQRGVASSLTAVSMALGIALMVGVIVIHAVAVRQFAGDAQGYHLIVGGKGGDLQLVLSTVYHLGESRYTLPYSLYREFVDGEYADLTEVAVPYCLGDSFDPRPDGAEGEPDTLYRVVATTPDLFDRIEYGTDEAGNAKAYRFRDGRNFRADRAFEAVLGSVVAARTGVGVGDLIEPTHGISGKGDKHDAFLVTGVLEPTGTANDRAVFVNIEGFYLLEGHALTPKDPLGDTPAAVLGARAAASLGVSVGDRLRDPAAGDGSPEHQVVAVLTETGDEFDRAFFGPTITLDGQALEGGGKPGAIPTELYDNEGEPVAPLPAAQREVSSILVLSNNMMGPTVLTTKINKNQALSAQAVAPTRVTTELLDGIVGPVRLVLLVLTVMIVIVASLSVLVSIYNSMSERAHDIAVMRALGASRRAVLLIVLGESVLLSLAGGLLGIVLGHALIGAAAPYVEARTGVQLAFWAFDPLELVLIPALVVLATLAGLFPAITAYRTDVARALSGSR